MSLQHGENRCTLEPGDAVYFDSTTAHSYICSGNKSANALIVTMHQLQTPQPAMNLRPLGGAMTAKGSGVNAPAGKPSTTLPTPARVKENLPAQQ